MGKIKAINISNLDGENTFYINQAILNKNKGIVNDRYYGNFKNSYEQVTFIESEKIDDFNKKIKKKLDYKDFRRNIITSGINLNKLLNKKIQINNVVFKIHELCQPCKYLQNKLEVKNLVKLLAFKSGVRAEILMSGEISINDQIKIDKGLNIKSVLLPFFFTLKSAAKRLSSTFFPNNSLKKGTFLKFFSNKYNGP